MALSLIIAYPFAASSISPSNNEVVVESSVLDKAVWTWVDQVDGEDVVFISRHAGGQWSARETVSSQGGANVVPTVTTVGITDLVAIWTNYSGPQAMLRYRRLVDGVWSEEAQYHSGLSSNTAPTVVQDGDARLWMVWSGFSGISDDIYYTTWEGAHSPRHKPSPAMMFPMSCRCSVSMAIAAGPGCNGNSLPTKAMSGYAVPCTGGDHQQP